MLDSQNTSASTTTTTTTTSRQQQIGRKIEGTDFADEYFASLSGPARRLIADVVAVKEAYKDVWDGLENGERDNIIDENIIRSETILRYERSTRSNDCGVRLSSFGVDKVYPRLQMQTGQKINTIVDDNNGSQGEDLGSDCTYSYRDEHSAPWSWMTRSQQELSFESGIPDPGTNEDGLETLTASPSRILNRQSMLIRQSKGNPLYAKPVQIPVVPELPKVSGENSGNDMLKETKISPHKINNFVYQDDERIVLDFGSPENNPEDVVTSAGPTSPSTATQNLIAKMKTTTSTLRKSLSNVSNVSGTLRRKMSQRSTHNGHDDSSPTSTLSSQTHLSSMSSTQKLIIKPSQAPPPPPARKKRSEASKNEDDVVKPLEEFKIDLDTKSDIPKTGFDFLDNW